GIQLLFAVRRVEEQGPEHGLADPVDLPLPTVAIEAYPRPQADPGVPKGGIGQLQGDGGHITPGERVAGGAGEYLRGVPPLAQRLVELDDGNAVGGERIRGQPGPGQRAAGEGEHLPRAALAQECAGGALAGSWTISAEDPNLLLPGAVGLGEG